MSISWGSPPRTLKRCRIQHEQIDCQQFAGFMRILAPKHKIVWTHIPNGGARHKRTAGILKSMGTRAGVWDYYFRKRGLPTLWIEFKAGKNAKTNEQADWQADLAMMGDEFELVYSTRQALEALTARGFLPIGAYYFSNGTINLSAAI